MNMQNINKYLSTGVIRYRHLNLFRPVHTVQSIDIYLKTLTVSCIAPQLSGK